MSRLAQRVADKRLLRIVRRFLESGMMQNGVCVERNEGTPQGGVISPLLANLFLHYTFDLWQLGVIPEAGK
jgi:RNA-directed DNA polymerase